MSSVVRRTVRSTPYRDARETWDLIVAILTRDAAADARAEMDAVAGIVASTIADRSPLHVPIAATCDGPQTRFYCLFDDDALESDASNESGVQHDGTNGDWRISIPCQKDDLTWVQAALKEKSSRITARDGAHDASIEKAGRAEASGGLVLDPKGFLA